MSIDVSRTYIIPIDRLTDAFAAAAEIAPRVREPRSVSIALPDGSSVAFPFAPEEDPPYSLEVGGYLSFEYGFRASGEDIEDYVRQNPEPPFVVKRLKGGGLRAIIWLDLIVAIEPPFASFGFHNLGKYDCDVLELRSVRDVLDYIGRCAEGLVTYETVMGEHRLLSPSNRTCLRGPGTRTTRTWPASSRLPAVKEPPKPGAAADTARRSGSWYNDAYPQWSGPLSLVVRRWMSP